MFFPAHKACELLQTGTLKQCRYTICCSDPQVPEEMWASVASGWSESVWLLRSSQITILIHPQLLRPPGLQQATENSSHSNRQACRCPWGSFLDRIPRCPLAVKGRPLRWMVVYLCSRVSFSVPPATFIALPSVRFIHTCSECRNSPLN